MNIREQQKQSKHFSSSNAGSVYIFSYLFLIAITLIISFLPLKDGFLFKMIAAFAVELAFLGAFLVSCKTTNAHKKLKPNFTKRTSYVVYMVSAITIVATIFCCVMINTLFVGGIQKLGYSSTSARFATNWWQLLISILVVCAFPALLEEIVFRGMIANGAKKYGTIGAIMLSSLMFMFYHGSLLQTYFQFMLGVILAIAIIFSEDIKVCITVHFCNNFTVILTDYFNFSIAYNTKAWFIAVSIVLFVVAVAIIVGYYFFMKWFYGKNKSKEPQITVSQQPELLMEQPKEEIDDGNAIFITSFVIGLIYWVVNVIISF